MRRIIALIDYENIGTLEEVPLSSYEEIIVFTGAKQSEVHLPTTGEVRDIRIRQVTKVSKNNVDFHLVFELGRLSVSLPETDFHIISYDKGYDGIISYLNQSGYQCQRWEPATPSIAAPKKEQAPAKVKNEEDQNVKKWADKIQSCHKKCMKAMPKSVESLNHYLKAHINTQWSAPLAAQVQNELIKRGLITIKEKQVVWKNHNL